MAHAPTQETPTATGAVKIITAADAARMPKTRAQTVTTGPVDKRKTSHPLTFGLSFVAALGIIFMIVALGIGVLQGADVDTRLTGTVFVLGLMMMVSGIAAWVGVTRPFSHFDDISQPRDTGHHAHAPAHVESGANVTEKESIIVVEDAHGHAIETLPNH